MIRAEFLFPDGTARAVRPDALTLRRDSDTPADSLELVFYAGGRLFITEPCGVRLMRRETLVFLGIVDEHTVRTDGAGHEERFYCRSLAARMVDSEALPGLLQMPSVRLMEQWFLKPLGLSVGDGDRAPKAGEMTVEKGVSVWAAVSEFARRFLRVTPYCDRDGTVHFATIKPKVLSPARVLSAEVTRKPYGVLSRVTVQDAKTGAYGTVYENPDAAGVIRLRYLSAHAGRSPRELFSKGERERVSAKLVLEEYIDADPGDLVEAGMLGLSETLETASVRYTVSTAGERTELRLCRPADA